jgi:hypothetical protein
MDIVFCNGSKLLFGCEGTANTSEGLGCDKIVYVRHRHAAPIAEAGVQHCHLNTTLTNVDLSQLAKMLKRGIQRGRR